MTQIRGADATSVATWVVKAVSSAEGTKASPTQDARARQVGSARAGAAEAWLVKDGKVTEGSSSNAWIVDDKGQLITHPLGEEILGGITRQTAIACAESLQMKVVERAFSVEEALKAREAFITSAMNLVTPVIAIDGKKIGGGAPGPVAARLRAAYVERCGAM